MGILYLKRLILAWLFESLMGNSLAAKASNVIVNAVAGDPGASSTIKIRGGIFTSGLMASIIRKDAFIDALNFMKKYHILRDKVEYDLEYHDEILKMLYNKMKERFGDVETLDGLKAIIDEDSWVLVRKSNTENIIRISAESNSLQRVRNIHLQIKELIKQSYEQIK